MSFSSTTSRNTYTGNNSTATYNYTFRIFETSDLLVVERDTLDVETTLALTTDYTVTGAGSASGGTIVLTAGNLATGHVLSIRRVLPIIQETDIRNQGAFYPEIHEDQFDKLAMIDQAQQDELDRSIKLAESIDPADFSTLLPAGLSSNPNATLVVNATGDGFDLGPTSTEIGTAAADSISAGNHKTTAQRWAIETADTVVDANTLVDSNEYSSKEYAIGTQIRGVAGKGSAKDWATYTSGTVDDVEYSAKQYAIDAAASAASAATAASASLWADVQYLTFASSPVSVVDASAGTLYEVDCTAGNVVVNLPSIAALTLSGPWAVGFKKTDSSSNTITINRDGADTIDGNTSKVISRQYAGATLIPDIDPAPDKWTSLSFGEVPIVGEIVGTTDTQALSNKTFSDAVTLAEIASPSTPASGFGKVYFKSDGFLYQKNDDGTETKVGAGSGGVNYISNPDAESGVTGWSTYADAAASRPVDATGGSPNITWTRTTSSPLKGTGSFLFTKDAVNRQGQGTGFDFTIDRSSRAKVLRIAFDYEILSGTYSGGTSSTDSDLIAYIYDVTNAALIEPAPIKLDGGVIGTQYRYVGSFQAASNSESYRLIIHCATTSAVAYTVQFDSFEVGPQVVSIGALAGEWTSFTPTGSWSTNTTYTGYSRRVGDSEEYDVKISLSGAPTSATLTLNLRPGRTIDTSKLTYTTQNRSIYGTASIFDSGTAGYVGFVTYDTSTTVSVNHWTLDTLTTSFVRQAGQVTQAAPMTFANGDAIHLRFCVPISGWGSSQVLSSETDTRVIAASIRLDIARSIANTTATKIDFQSSGALFDTHGAFDYTNDRYIAPIPGKYKFSGWAGFAANATGIREVSYKKNGGASQYTSSSPSFGTYTQAVPFSFLEDLKAGDYIEIYVFQSSGGALDLFSNGSVLNVERISGPSQIAASETVSALYTGAPPTGTLNSSFNIVTFGTKVKDSHGSYVSGSYTVPVSGQYDIGASIDITHASIAVNQFIGISIFIDGTETYTRYAWAGSTSNTELLQTIDVKSLQLRSGQIITIRTSSSGTTPTFASNAKTQNFYINRSGNY